MKVTAPIYLLQNRAPCWKCGAVQPVVALACASLQDEECEDGSPGNGDEPALLMYITELPPDWLKCIHQVRNGFELRYSLTAESAYYVNTCECGTFFGDFFLHKPGGAFFPMGESEEPSIQVKKLPVNGSFEINCGNSIGVAAAILQHGERHN